jgi:hypothetical protein
MQESPWPVQQAWVEEQPCSALEQVAGGLLQTHPAAPLHGSPPVVWQVRRPVALSQQLVSTVQFWPVSAQVGPPLVPQVPLVCPSGMLQVNPVQQSPGTVHASPSPLQISLQWLVASHTPEQQSAPVEQVTPVWLQVFTAQCFVPSQ